MDEFNDKYCSGAHLKSNNLSSRGARGDVAISIIVLNLSRGLPRFARNDF
jgi:hypothetical protein